MTPAEGHLHAFDTPAALARGAAEWLLRRAEASEGRFVVALSGGSTPKAMYAHMRDMDFPWTRMQFVFGDERFVPPDHPDSNAHMAAQALLDHVPVPPENVHRVPTVGLSPDEAAARYAATLARLYGAASLDDARPLFDVVLLGLGEDGHTASLIPGQPVLDERARWVAAVAAGRPEARITLTYPAIASSHSVAFLVQGQGKRAILRRVLSGDDSVPAGRVQSAEIVWLADRAAAG